jgi:uncharacterized protein YycO
MKRLFILFTIALFWQCSTAQKKSDFSSERFQTGDIIFQETSGPQSMAVSLATDSRYSHVGMVAVKGGEVMVMEAVQPVQIIPIKDFVRRGVDKHYVVKRLKDDETVLTKEMLEEMMRFGQGFLGKNYDIYFNWSDDQLYCSELVWKIYENTTGLHIGNLKSLGDYDLSHPLVKKIMAERYGSNIPMDEMMIAPIDMMNSPLLETIRSH